MTGRDSKLTIAVHMVTYNHEAFIEKAIESVMMQDTSYNYKLFVGEDHSTDDTRRICEKLKAKYPEKITLVLNDTNLGSKKNGLQIYEYCFHSGAKYIALLEGDDYWSDPFKLQKQVDFLEANKDYTFSFTRFLTTANNIDFKDENDHFFKSDSDLVYDFNMFTKGWYGGTLTLVFKTSVVDYSVFGTYEYFRDIHLYTELLKKGNGICQNFVSAVYRVHDQGQHNSLTKLQQAETAVYCYQELYLDNHKIDALKIKYRYFAHNYIKELVDNRSYLKALQKTFSFGLILKEPAFIFKMTKIIIKSNHLVLRLRSFLKKRKRINQFKGSKHYWEERYKKNKDSGPGSYGRLAKFKADILNEFVKDHIIKTIIEYGCGDGNQLSLAHYPSYIGFDVSNKALEICREKFRDDKSKNFYNAFDDDYKNEKAELTLSLDVIYHLIEDEVFETYMDRLFKTSNRYVIIYSNNYNERSAAHVRSRKFTDWVEKNMSENWELMEVIKNKYPFDKNDPNNTSMADFYVYKKRS